MIYDFIAIDFETANSNSNSACSMGLVAVKNLTVVYTKSFLIHPPSLNFHNINISIHGVTPDDVKNSPRFPEVWEQIKSYFTGNIIVAHNASFDMSVLKCSLLEYDIELPNFTYMCSMQLSDFTCDSENCGRSLKDRAEYFDVELENHHNSLCDALACAKIVIASMDKIRFGNLPYSFNNSISLYRFEDLKPIRTIQKKKVFSKIVISEIAATTDDFNSEHPLCGKNIVFTGELESMDRGKAMQKVVNLGGLLKNAVSSKTDYLIVGIQDKTIVGEDGMSSKEEKAYALNEKGHGIKILNECDFLKLIN
jgi:DNA polymerase-3 subunit epsilon